MNLLAWQVLQNHQQSVETEPDRLAGERIKPKGAS
jgi:hypothetical protein